jgi:hypothetical protein
MPSNYRLHWGIEALGFAQMGSNTFTAAHGVQSAGMSLNFNLDPVIQLSQTATYEQVEEIPDVELSCEKVLDGYPLLYHLGSLGSTAVDIFNRSNRPVIIAMSLFSDTQTAASGQPIGETYMSGMYFSNVGYSFPVEGNATESVTFVGNHALYLPPASTNFSGGFTNTDVPLAQTYNSGGVQRRVNFLYSYQAGTGLDANGAVNTSYSKPGTVLPPDVQGISASGTNNLVTNDQYACAVQRVNVTANAGRGRLLELGHRKPYFRFLEIPVTVTTEIEIISKSGHTVNALEVGPYANSFNTRNSTIKIAAQDSTFINLGTNNRLTSLAVGGGDTGGSNATITYTYQNLNEFSVSHSQDPSGIS